MTNSIRLPMAISTRWPATRPAAPSPVATRATSSSRAPQVTLRPADSTTARISGRSSAASATSAETSWAGMRARIPQAELPTDEAQRASHLPHADCSRRPTASPLGSRVTPEKSRKPLNLQQRSALAGEAAAAAAEVETALATPADPTSAAFFDVDNTMMQGASIFYFARGLHRRKFFTTREIASAMWKQAYFRFVGVEDPEHVAQSRASALSFIAGPHRARAGGARRGDLRRGDGAPHLARHPSPGTAAPRRGAAGLAGHGRPDRDRPDHRPPARSHRRPGHGRRARRRRLHRAAGGRDAARAGEGRGGAGARRARGARPRRAARRTPTPSTT